MRLSRYFLPTLKETPGEAQIASHRLMLRAGMIRQATSGIYSWLPLGWKVLKNIEDIIRQEQDRFGAIELMMPILQSAELWRESGRYEAYGKEMLRIRDRHDRELLYAPTAEELIVDIFRSHAKSYRDLPRILYEIQWKFRDEIRPRFGVMRSREFMMKDAYSFDLDRESARKTYNRMVCCYLRTFARMGLRAVPVQADTGAIGGNLSHEFQILAETGENEVFCDQQLLDLPELQGNVGPDDDLDSVVERVFAYYAAADDMHEPEQCPVPAERLASRRGIEVGHVFNLSTKYSEVLGCYVTNRDGEQVPVEMGCFGIGVSRLVGAIIEAHHDEAGIVWPDSVAPFQVGLINLKTGDSACDDACEDLYRRLTEAGVEVLYDDREERAGAKFNDMDLIGLPWQVVVGPRGLQAGEVEVKRRATGERVNLAPAEAVQRVAG